MDDEMSDRMDDQAQPGDTEVERRLVAYADARLSPTPEAEARTRARIIAVADPPSHGRRRPPIALLLAACLTIAVLLSGIFATSPGGRLYAVALWFETANLPIQVVDRARAEVDRLERRIDEIRVAIATGDAGATEAALSAYSGIVIATGAEVEGDATAAETVRATLTREVVVLAGFVDTVPAPAEDAATRALQSCNMILDGLEQP